MTLGEYIVKYREKHDLSQRQFANRCGVSNAYISNIEAGFNPHTGKPISPSVVSLKKLAAGLGLTVNDLTMIIDEGGEAEPNEWDLSEKEKSIVAEFRAMSEPEQNVIMATAKAINKKPAHPKG